MMDKLISQQAAIDAFYQYPNINWTTLDVMEKIKELPSVQPERKTGHWIKTARWGRVYYCDRCRNYLDFDGVNAGRGSTNFCPNCGADMRGEEHD